MVFSRESICVSKKRIGDFWDLVMVAFFFSFSMVFLGSPTFLRISTSKVKNFSKKDR